MVSYDVPCIIHRKGGETGRGEAGEMRVRRSRGEERAFRKEARRAHARNEPPHNDVFERHVDNTEAEVEEAERRRSGRSRMRRRIKWWRRRRRSRRGRICQDPSGFAGADPSVTSDVFAILRYLVLCEVMPIRRGSSPRRMRSSPWPIYARRRGVS
jgi:hypothetical protein